MKPGGYILFAAAVGCFIIGSQKTGMNAAVFFVGAALACAIGALLLTIEKAKNR